MQRALYRAVPDKRLPGLNWDQPPLGHAPTQNILETLALLAKRVRKSSLLRVKRFKGNKILREPRKPAQYSDLRFARIRLGT